MERAEIWVHIVNCFPQEFYKALLVIKYNIITPSNTQNNDI